MRTQPLNSCRLGIALLVVLRIATMPSLAGEPQSRQITFGPRHHFFGYIGHVRTVPWNASGRYLAALETEFQDRMPRATDAANVVLLDTQREYAVVPIEKTRAWNFQQGTMLYWRPGAAETELFFNDRDLPSNQVLTVLLEITPEDGVPRARRRREYRFDTVAIANSGVAPDGQSFAAINYGRLARLRPVTGYPAAADGSAGVRHPANDGVFVVDVPTGNRRLVASFQRLAREIRPRRPDVDQIELFVNHTLWSPGGRWLFFFCRGDFDDKSRRIDVPCVVRPDGSQLTLLKDHFGGHPEWLDERRMIGRWDNRQGLYDVERQAFVGTLGAGDTRANPGGDIALSPDGKWLVNGSSRGVENFFTLLRIADGKTLACGQTRRGSWREGELRIDPAPCWNRNSTAIVAPGLADDEHQSRQMFLIEVPDAGRRNAPQGS